VTDPFESLELPPERVEPRPAFTRGLRARLAAELGADRPADELPPDDRVPTIDLPDRRTTMPDTTTLIDRQVVTPYLAVDDGPAALDFYTRALGAEVVVRMVGDDGRVGHAEFHVGAARFYLSDEYPEIGVHSPHSLGGTTVTLHVDLDDVDDAFRRAVDAGATAMGEPADQPHGARHGTLIDPFGHRWMLSQQVEQLTDAELTERMGGSGFAVETAGSTAAVGAIWPAVNAADAPAMIRFIVDVLGFSEQLVVPGDGPGVVDHSQLTWPEGGTVQVGSAHRPGNVFSDRPVGGQSLYVVTADPDAVYRRCVAACVEVIGEPAPPDYDPDGSVFSVRDHEGNLWSFGTYDGG
jgi:PhnB protein